MSGTGYVDYFAALDLTPEAKQGEVRKNYRKMMKDLLLNIGRTRLTEEKRDRLLLDMARLNAAFYILRDNERREKYVADRRRVIALEEEWRNLAEANAPGVEDARRQFDRAMRDFLTTYMEDLVLEAGRDHECIEASNWDRAHERHASRVLRYDRHRHYQMILERLPFHEVTAPLVDWEERRHSVDAILTEACR
ncbi:MAG: hypothetical protein KA184_08045 [Candidatus Hydrogenedentes bacterium]|nr:hypothetical protein [Candidatus Hydrogenedentota bacterium]